MRVRFTSAVGLPVVEDETLDVIGTLSGILIQPDTGVIEGFFVRVPGMLGREELFLSSLDILHWGTRITVRNHDVLAPIDERVRLLPLLADRRTVLGQPIMTEDGMPMGRCRDIQFDTRHFRLEWLFPRRFFRWRTPIPATQILEVRPEAVIIRAPGEPVPESAPQTEVPLLPQMPDAA